MLGGSGGVEVVYNFPTPPLPPRLSPPHLAG
eukprot:gene27134-biopygen17685